MKGFFDYNAMVRAGRRAVEMAEHGTREEKSGRFLPPPGWKGQLITGTSADLIPPPISPRKRGHTDI